MAPRGSGGGGRPSKPYSSFSATTYRQETGLLFGCRLCGCKYPNYSCQGCRCCGVHVYGGCILQAERQLVAALKPACTSVIQAAYQGSEGVRIGCSTGGP